MTSRVRSAAGMIFQAAIAAALLGATMVGYDQVYPLLHPARDYYSVLGVVVDDMRQGEEGRVWYGRDTKVTHTARWRVGIQEVLKDGSLVPRCSGGGIGVYTPQVSVPRFVTLKWYTGEDCVRDLKPGTYTIRTVWTMLRPRTLQSEEAWSNKFEVTP